MSREHTVTSSSTKQPQQGGSSKQNDALLKQARGAAKGKGNRGFHINGSHKGSRVPLNRREQFLFQLSPEIESPEPRLRR